MITDWSLHDLQASLQRERRVVVSIDPVHHMVHALSCRRLRHNLTRRQDAEAIASAQRVLD